MEPEVEGGGLKQHPLADLLLAAKVGTAESSDLREVREAPLHFLAPLAKHPLSPLLPLTRLTEGANVPDALQVYECERRQKTAVLFAQGRRTARVMRMTSPIACKLREVAIRLVPVTLIVRTYARINRRAGTDVTHVA